MSYVQDELVRRRGWLSAEEYLESFTIARILPGSSGQSVAVLSAQSLLGTRAAAVCIVPYILPGALMALALSFVMFGGSRPPWVSNGLHGLAAAAIALVMATSLRNVKAIRLTPGKVALLAITCAAYGPLGVGLVPVLGCCGAISLLIHRPKGGTQ